MKILFVCTGNTCRSPMAETMFKQMAKVTKLKNIEAFSAGLFCENGVIINKKSNVALRKLGFKGSRHKSQSITNLDLSDFGLIITMTEKQKNSISFLKNTISFYELLGFDISDPFMMMQEVYNECAIDINSGIKKLIEILQKRL